MIYESIADHEAFEKKLERLSKMSPQEKAAYAKLLYRREDEFEIRHRDLSDEIAAERAFAEEAAADENYNHDQPI